MQNLKFIIPINYFYETRLKQGTILFHLIFEWIAAILIVAIWGKTSHFNDILNAVICYIAFISVYEIGYIYNDIHSAKHEINGRHRGQNKVTSLWIRIWICTRVSIFFICVQILQQWQNPSWWLFFGTLALVFYTHNNLLDPELKTSTFLWLAWFRFMAPVIFVVNEDQRMGVAFIAAMTYVSFRYLGYLDSKGLLLMPGRKTSKFRMLHFLMSLVAPLVTYGYDGASASWALAIYFAIAGTAASVYTILKGYLKD